DVLARVAHHGRFARGTAGGVDPGHLLAGHGEQTEGVVVAKVLLVREGKFGKVRERLQVRRMHSGRIEAAPVVRDVVVAVLDGPLHALELQRRKFVARALFDWLQFAGAGDAYGHGVTPSV